MAPLSAAALARLYGPGHVSFPAAGRQGTAWTVISQQGR
jgi:hypothetical protein